MVALQVRRLTNKPWYLANIRVCAAMYVQLYGASIYVCAGRTGERADKKRAVCIEHQEFIDWWNIKDNGDVV